LIRIRIFNFVYLLNRDKGLIISAWQALFEGTTAIKYWVEGAKKGFWRVLVLEDDLFHPPPQGWGEALYICCLPAGHSEHWCNCDFECS
jgi:hypothetical protein